MQRRHFLQAAAAISGAAILSPGRAVQAVEPARLHVSANQYTCNNLYKRDGKNFLDHLEEIKTCGIDGIEPTIAAAADAESIGLKLRAAGLEMRSFYASPDFFSSQAAATSELRRITESAEKAKEFGAGIVICNSKPKSGKTDEEIFRQTEAYTVLGQALADRGMKLGIHYHTPEWEFGGREMLHLMSWTEPELVGFCFDLHWSYRACGNSLAAVSAHMKMFASRIVEFHFRQSIAGTWSETFGEGDIDHSRVADFFRKLGGRLPHCVLEQASEKNTPKTMQAPEILRASAKYVRTVFGSTTG